MDLYDKRQAMIRELIQQRYGGNQSAFAHEIEKSPNYVSRMLSVGKSRKKIGETTARFIEKRHKLPAYSLDGETLTKQDSMERQTFHGISISLDGARLGQEWEKLDEPFRTQIQQMVESMVGRQVREKRAGNKSKDNEKRPAG